MVQRIVVVGTSGHAGVALDAIERSGGYEVLGLVDTFRKPGETAFGYPVIGHEDGLPAFLRERGDFAAVIAIGDNFQRRRMRDRLRELVPGVSFVTVVHPAACVSPRATLGEGAMLLAGSIVCAGAAVGEGCLLNTGSSLDHDCRMGSYASLGPRAVVGGDVRIGDCSAIAIGATVLHGRRIGEHCVIGAGAVVLGNMPDQCVAYGVPARIVRQRKPGEAYL